MYITFDIKCSMHYTLYMIQHIMYIYIHIYIYIYIHIYINTCVYIIYKYKYIYIYTHIYIYSTPIHIHSPKWPWFVRRVHHQQGLLEFLSLSMGCPSNPVYRRLSQIESQYFKISQMCPIKSWEILELNGGF